MIFNSAMFCLCVIYETTLWLVLVDVDVDLTTRLWHAYYQPQLLRWFGLFSCYGGNGSLFLSTWTTLLAPLSSLPLPSSVVPCRFLPFSPLSDRWCYFSTISTQYQLHLLTQPSSLQFSFSTCPYLLQNTTFF